MSGRMLKYPSAELWLQDKAWIFELSSKLSNASIFVVIWSWEPRFHRDGKQKSLHNFLHLDSQYYRYDSIGYRYFEMWILKVVLRFEFQNVRKTRHRSTWHLLPTATELTKGLEEAHRLLKYRVTTWEFDPKIEAFENVMTIWNIKQKLGVAALQKDFVSGAFAHSYIRAHGSWFATSYTQVLVF